MSLGRTERRQSLGRILPELGKGAAVAADNYRAERRVLFEAQQKFPTLELLLHQDAGVSIMGDSSQKRLQPAKGSR